MICRRNSIALSLVAFHGAFFLPADTGLPATASRILQILRSQTQIYHLTEGVVSMSLNIHAHDVDTVRRSAMALCAALGLAIAVPGVAADPGQAKAAAMTKVVFQVSDGDPKKWN